MRRTTTRAVCALVAVLLSGSAAAVTALDPAGASVARNAAATATPSPSATGDSGAAAELTGDIAFTPASGTFEGERTVTLATAVAGAELRYTTDGTVPTATSPLYSEPLTLSRTTQVRARAFVDGEAAGAMGSALYVARSFDADHDHPILLLDAYGGGKPDKTTFKDVAAMIMDTSGGTTSLAQAPAVATRAGFRMRGQSSSHYEKLPYRIELWDNANEEADYSLLGMPADSDWALRSPFPDKSLIRDAFAYDEGRAIGLGAPRYRFVEVYLNLDDQPLAAADYQGVFLLVETVKRAKDRVDIAKLRATDLTEPQISGGYMMQFNFGVSEPPTLRCTRTNRQSSCWSDLELQEPKNPAAEQLAWITAYVQKFHDALHGSDPSNPDTGYPAYLDVDSFVNLVVHNELGRENDAYFRSTRLYKDREGKIVAGPLWDYDLAYGTLPSRTGTMPITGWQYQSGAGTDWFSKLMADPTFRAKVVARWQELRRDVLSDEQLTARVDTLAGSLTAAAGRNFARWPILGQVKVGPFDRTQVSETWEQQITVLKSFLLQRAAWLDANWKPAASPSPSPSASPSPSPSASA